MYCIAAEGAKSIYLNYVKQILRDSALDVVRRDQQTDGTTLRQLLIDEFGDREPV